MKAIIYTRVSSDEQVKGTSLDDQERQCREHCKRNGIEVVALFREEGASAKSVNRREFLKAIEYCRVNRNQIDVFVVFALNRFARNMEDHILVSKTLSEYGTKLVSVSENIGDKPAEKFMERMLAAMAEMDNENRKERCSGGMSARIDGGIWPWKGPVGYKKAPGRESGDKKSLPDVPEENIFPILQTALREFSRGEHTQATFAQRLIELNLEIFWERKITLQGVQVILKEKRLRFYAGELYNRWTGEYKPGLHVPMLTLEEVSNIQLVLSGKKRKLPKTRVHALFPLRGGTALCGSCRRTLTGSSSKGNTVLHHYYHCYYKKCELYGKGLRKKDVEDSFVEKLDRISPTDNFVALFKKAVVKEWESRWGQHDKVIKGQVVELKKLEQKLARIYDMREDGSYTLVEFRERKEKTENQIKVLSISKHETNIDRMEIEVLLEKATVFLFSLGTHWKQQPIHIQQRFQQLVFPEGIPCYRNTGVGTGKLGLIFELNRNFVAQKSTWVDPSGFEPLTSSLQMKRSTN